MALPGGGVKRGAGHYAQAVNMDTMTWLDSEGHEHKMHPGNRPPIGPDTHIIKNGHEVKKFKHHRRDRTPVHDEIVKRANPHPNDLVPGMLKEAAKAERAEERTEKRTPLLPGGGAMAA